MQLRVKIFALMIVLIAHPIAFDRPKEFIIWNVGQGLWTTLSDSAECRHFDMGGEVAPTRTVKELCYGKRNFIFLSHEDWDHVGFVQKTARLFAHRCLVAPPTAVKKHTKKLIQKIPACGNFSDIQMLDLDFHRNSNESSRIIKTQGVLLPGDSTSRMEKSWSYLIKGMNHVKILVLGHHGSRTSTSQILLDRLPALKISVASAREHRYGHPHLAVRKRLRKNGIPLLRTEDWGHIRILLK